MCLFDLNDILTNPRQIIDNNMVNLLKSLPNVNVDLGIVGGSDIVKILEQLNGDTSYFLYVCSENGLVSFKNNVKKNFREHIVK